MASLAMPIIPTTATTLSFAKKVCFTSFVDIVCLSPALIAEVKRIVQDSEIMKYFFATEIWLIVGKMIRDGRNGIKTVVKNWKFVLEMNIFRLRYGERL